MNAQEIFINAARVLYDDYLLYKNERKNKENTDNAKLEIKPEPKKKKKCC